jgi:hypothetical protein
VRGSGRPRWVEGAELFEIEPQLSREALGAIVTDQSQVIASKFMLALATAAKRKASRYVRARSLAL